MVPLKCLTGLPWWLSGKDSAHQCDTHGFHPWVRKIPGEENGNPLKCSCLGKPIDRGDWQATVHGITKSWTWLDK